MPVFKNKKVYEHKYNSTLEFVFRWSNAIRALGIYVMYEAKMMKVSGIKNEYIGEISSDIFLFFVGVIITGFGPDIIDWLKAKKIPNKKE